MPDTAAILRRIEGALPTDREVRLSELRALHARDPEAVFELALCDLPADAPIAVRGLQRLSRTLSLFMREGFVIKSAANQTYATSPRGGGVLALDDGRIDEAFLRGLYACGSSGDKMRPEVRSDAYVAFFMEEHQWDSTVRATKPLRVEHDDVQAVLNGSPRHQYNALLDSAREVVRAPSVVYHGLRKDGSLKGGFAFCGKPSRWWSNAGHEPVRPSFVFLVFVTECGCVFDWDWAPECAKNPGQPRNAEERFPEGSAPSPVFGELLLGNIRGREPAPFRPRHAWYSATGDCVFWYFSEAVAYADRYDDYLTAFFAVDPPSPPATRCVGFKLKSVSRLTETIEIWARPGDIEGIGISFDSKNVEVTLSYLMKAWQAAALPHSHELFAGMQFMKDLGERGVEAIRADTSRIPIPKQSLRSEAAMS
jgi:hypothetical protein